MDSTIVPTVAEKNSVMIVKASVHDATMVMCTLVHYVMLDSVINLTRLTYALMCVHTDILPITTYVKVQTTASTYRSIR